MTENVTPTPETIEEARGLLEVAASFDNLDASVRLLQDRIGQTDGGAAGIHFSGDNDVGDVWEAMTVSARVEYLDAYLDLEKANVAPEASPTPR